MGQTWEDRLDMAVSLAELEIESIPINALMPIKGTPLENQGTLLEDDILRTIAFSGILIQLPISGLQQEDVLWKTMESRHLGVVQVQRLLEIC